VKPHSKHDHKHKTNISFIILGISSLFWLIFRSGKKPSRLQYPCQRIAAANSIAFLSWLATILNGHFLYRKIKKYLSWQKIITLILTTALVFEGAKAYKLWQKNLSPKVIWGQSGISRVVWVSHPQATTSSSYNPRAGNQEIINQMLDQAIMGLTEQNSVSGAWTKLFQDRNEKNGLGQADYKAGEKIAIKVNFNNSWDCDNNGCPVYQVVNAIIRQLVNKGIPQADIGVYDTSRGFPDYFTQGIRNIYPQVKLNPDQDSWPPCTSSQGVLGANFGCFLTEAKYLINVPLLRTHGMAGVTLSFKNHLGSTGSPEKFHNMFFGTKKSTNSLVQLNSHSIIKNKTILVVADALYGLKSGGPDGFPNIRPNSLFLSTDPVAVDSVMIDYLESIGGSIYNPNDPRITYRLAAQEGLGNYATSCNSGSCSLDYQGTSIQLIKCPNAVCPGGTTPIPTSTPTPTLRPTATPTPTPTPTYVKGDVNHSDGADAVNLQDILMVLGNWMKTPSSVANYFDPLGDSKINSLDFGWVLRDWNK
jgi:uncharacterized protein (DUF362 family)